MKLRENPATREIVADSGMLTLYHFDGTPISRPAGADDWKVVGEVPCLFDWQRDPGLYGPHYATYTFSFTSERDLWVAGGSILYIRNWIEYTTEQLRGIDHIDYFPLAIWADRNTARANADIQW